MLEVIGLVPVSQTLNCRLHGGPRPCFACRNSKSTGPKGRFLGTPRAGWKPNISEPKKPILPPNWKGNENPRTRRPANKAFWKGASGPQPAKDASWIVSKPRLKPAPNTSAIEWMEGIDAKRTALGLTGADLERLAGIPVKTLSRVRLGAQAAGVGLRAKVERALEGQA